MLNRNGSRLEYFQLIQSPLLGSVTITVGGALIVTNSTLTIDNCMFDRNSANVGGATFIESKSKVFIKNSDFTFNHATGCHHSNLCLGGALFIEGMSRVNISNSSFENNESDQDIWWHYLHHQCHSYSFK